MPIVTAAKQAVGSLLAPVLILLSLPSLLTLSSHIVGGDGTSTTPREALGQIAVLLVLIISLAHLLRPQKPRGHENS